MKKTILGLVLAGAAYLFPNSSPAQEEEEPDHYATCGQQFQSLLEKTIDEFSGSLPTQRLQKESREALGQIVEEHYAGKPLEEMLESWRGIKVKELSNWTDVEDRVDSVMVSLRSAYQEECLTGELKNWRTRAWLRIKEDVYKKSIGELCTDEDVHRECERGLREEIITKADLDKTPPQACPGKGRKVEECYDLFIPAIKKRVLNRTSLPTIAEVRNVSDERGRRRPYILTPEVNENAQVKGGIVSWNQDFTIEDLRSGGGTKLFCRGDAVSSIVVKNHTLRDKSKSRASVEVKDIAWNSGQLGTHALTCIAYEEDRRSLPYSFTFKFDGTAKRNPREIFHSVQSLEALFFPDAQGRFKSDNRLTVYSGDDTRYYVVANGFIQLGKENAEKGILREGEFFSGIGMAGIEQFRTSPFGVALQVGYSTGLNGPAGGVRIEGNELFSRDFQYQLDYKASLLEPRRKQLVEGLLEAFIMKLRPWERPRLAAFGFFVRARGDFGSLQDFSLGAKVRTDLFSRYSTNVELKLGYHWEQSGEGASHRLLQAISAEF